MADQLIATIKKVLPLSEELETKIKEEQLDLYTFGLLNEKDLETLGFKMGARKLLLNLIKNMDQEVHNKSQNIFHSFMNIAGDARGGSSSSSNSNSSASNFVQSPKRVARPVIQSLPIETLPEVQIRTIPLKEDVILPHIIEEDCSILFGNDEYNVLDILYREDRRNTAIKGPVLAEKLLSNQPCSVQERRFLVKTLGRFLMKNCAIPDKPTKLEKQKMAYSLIKAFPVLRAADTLNGYEHFFDPRNHGGYLENYIRTKRSRDPDIPTQRYGKRSNVVPVECQTNVHYLQQCQQSLQDQPGILHVLDNTRDERQTWINQQKPPIGEILLVYPVFTETLEAIQAEFYNCYKWEKELTAAWSEIQHKVIHLARQKLMDKHVEVIRLLRQVDDDNSYDANARIALSLLPYFLPCTPKKGQKRPKSSPELCAQMLFMNLQDELSLSEAVSKAEECGMKCPGIVIVNYNLYIKLGRQVFKVDESRNIVDALQLLFMCFFIFNLDYPEDLRVVYKYFEHITTVTSLKPTKKSMEGVLSPIVRDFVNDLLLLENC